MRNYLLLLLAAVAIPACRLGPGPAALPGETPEQVVARQTDEIARLKKDLDERAAQVKQLEGELAALRGLKPEWAQAEVRVASVVLGRFSHVAKLDPKSPGPDGLKLYLYLYDQFSEKAKRAGRIEIKAFDLKEERKLGDWAFEPAEALKRWKTSLLLDCFVLDLPWQTAPGDPNAAVVVRWQFDGVDGRTFSGSQELGFTSIATP